MLLAVLCVACGGPGSTPDPPKPAPPDAETIFSAAIKWNDPVRDEEVYLSGSARTFISQGRRVIEATIDDPDDSLTLTLALPDLEQTQYAVGDDLDASIVYAVNDSVVFQGSATDGDLAQVNDPRRFIATLVLDFEGFSLGGTVGLPR